MAPEASPGLLGGVVQFFKDKFSGPKIPPRKSGAFHMWWHQDGEKFKPGIGMELAVDSLVFIIEDDIPTDDFNIVVRVREKSIPIHVRRTVNDQVPNKGKTWHRYGAQFVGIAADNWDLIYRHVNDIPEPENKRAGEEWAPDDAYRMLPLTVQEKIVAILVEAKKLQEPQPGKSPLLKLYYSGIKKKPDGGARHFFTIHSRIKVDDEMVAYDTRFAVDDAGDVAVLP